MTDIKDMADAERRLLTKACGLEWVDARGYEGCNRTFLTAEDWELVREKVIVPNLDDFCGFLVWKDG